MLTRSFQHRIQRLYRHPVQCSHRNEKMWYHVVYSPPVAVSAATMRGHVRDNTAAQPKQVATAQDLSDLEDD